MHLSSQQQHNNNSNNNNNSTSIVNGECYDYRFGFCINGPHCLYRHVRRPAEEIESMSSSIPDWYFNKIKSVFAKDHVTNYQQIHDLLRQQTTEEDQTNFSLFSG